MTALHWKLNKSHHYALVMVDQQLLLLTSNTHRWVLACAHTLYMCIHVCMPVRVCLYMYV